MGPGFTIRLPGIVVDMVEREGRGETETERNPFLPTRPHSLIGNGGTNASAHLQMGTRRPRRNAKRVRREQQTLFGVWDEIRQERKQQ